MYERATGKVVQQGICEGRVCICSLGVINTPEKGYYMKPFVRGNFERTIDGVSSASIQVLNKAGLLDDANALSANIASATSYKEALTMCLQYVVIDFG